MTESQSTEYKESWRDESPRKGRYKIAVKVVDIFGDDTMKVRWGG
jgi:hypothetical protein